MKWLELLIEKYYANKETKILNQIERDTESLRCKTCEMLEKELALAHDRERRLIDLLHPTEMRVQENSEEPISVKRSHFVPWHVKRQQLETRARRDKDLATDKTTEELEKELGINNG